jgi:hypothetical protein
MEKTQKIIGICYAYNCGDEYDMVKEMGVTWLRMGAPFPWEDKMFGKVSERYKTAKANIKKAHSYGMNIMSTSPGLGSYRFDPAEKVSRWHGAWPDFAGEKGTMEFFDNVRKTTKWMAEDLGDLVSDYWQNMNEIDIPVFSKDYIIQIPTETARASAEGIVEANPKAKCGINLANYFGENGLKVADIVYRPGHKFSYIGDDQYFGSWQDRDVDAWTEVIEGLYKRYKLPVLANEWGYSSGGAVTKKHPAESEIPLGWTDVCTAKKWFNESKGGHTEEVQAEYLRKGHELFAQNPHCIGSFMFCWRDAHNCYHCGQTECPAECYWGVMHEDLSPKKAYTVVQKAIKDYYK